MKLDSRYRFQMAWDSLAIGVFATVGVLFCIKSGMNLYQLGLFFGVFFTVTMTLELPTGGLADKYGHLKVYRIAKGFELLNFSLLIFAKQFEVLLLASAIGGIGRSLSNGALEAWYVNQSFSINREADIRAKLKSTNYWVLLGLALGAITGGVLPEIISNHLVDYYLDGNQYKVSLLLALIIHLIAAIVSVRSFPEGENHTKMAPEASPKRRNIVGIIFVILGAREMKIILFLQITLGFLLSSHSVYWQPYVMAMLKVELGSQVVGIYVASNFLFSALVSWLVSRRSRSLNSDETLIFKYLMISSISIIFLSYTSSVSFFLLFSWLFISTCFLCRPVLSASVHQIVPKELRATGVSVLGLCLNLGGLITGYFLSQVSNQFSIEIAWKVSGGITIAVAIMLNVFWHLHKRKKDFGHQRNPVRQNKKV